MSVATLPGSSVGSSGWAGGSVLRSVTLVPRNVVIAALHAYRTVISPIYGDVCKYYPSCSAYALGAVQQHGVAKGAALTAARLARCHPWAQGGVDDVTPHRHFRHALTPRGFVVHPRKD